jgi:hypothetical protein
MPARVGGNFKSLLRRLPESVAEEVREQLRKTGQTVLSRAQSRAPVYHGRPRKGRTPGTLRSALSAKLLEKSLKLKVGVVGAGAKRRAYYAGWVERGHRIGYPGKRLAKLKPLSELGARGSTRYRLLAARRRSRVRRTGVPPHPFLYTFTRAELYQPFQKLWGRAIHRAAAGASNA